LSSTGRLAVRPYRSSGSWSASGRCPWALREGVVLRRLDPL